MKKTLVLLWAFTCFSPWARSQLSVTLNFGLGVLSNSTGTPISDGALLLVIGSASNTFSAPTPTSFLGGSADEVILWQGGINGSTAFGANTGTMILQLTSIPAGVITTGKAIEVFWYPTLTSAATEPGANTTYGWTNGKGTVAETAGSWIVPASGANQAFDFLTTSVGGPLSDTLGQASFTTSAVPEPASYAFGAGVLSLAFVAWRRKRVTS